MEQWRRTVTCGSLSAADVGKTVILNGWVHRLRDHGGVVFVNLRDRYGLTQVLFDETLKKTPANLKMEDCVSVKGTVRARPEDMVNPSMPTGAVEVLASGITVLNTCPSLPFMIDSEDDVNETLRLAYRYLDLRTEGMRGRLELRHKVTWAIRKYLVEKNFWEIETPTLIKSTPEGARDYLVPSRVNPGRFYALPQSPQLYKQILMVGGTDRYYQVARCYRDEDSRGDRQFEFTQIDLEMSFVSRDDVLELVEGMMLRVFDEVLHVSLSRPFPRLSWREAMEQYGTDKPDLRFGLEIRDFSPYVSDSQFGVFKEVLKTGGVVKALVLPGAAGNFSRKKIAELEGTARSRGAGGLAWMKVGSEGLEGGISKFFSDSSGAVIKGLGLNEGDLILLAGATWTIAVESLGAVRTRLGRELGLAKADDFEFCWVVDFPLFAKNEETAAWEPAHHMFSMPQEVYLDDMERDPGVVLGDLYDLSLNGNEVAGGSIRIHDAELQSRVFDIVGYPLKEAEERFGFLLKALRHGAPPHGGLAVGFDRLLMVMAQVETIRDVIAFPKNAQGQSPMDGSPSSVDERQLAELKLKLIPPQPTGDSRDGV